MFGHVMQIFRPPKILKPVEVLCKAADGARVLLPLEHGLIRREGVIGEDLSCPLDLGPVDRAQLKPFNIVVTVMRLLILFH
jgi:hypothetical protein